MSNNRDDDDYNDDYSEGEQEFAREEIDGDDEQHAQKVNGKLEVLQSEIENLNRKLEAVTLKNKQLGEDRERIEKENFALREQAESSKGKSSAGEDNKAELNNLRKKNEQLKDQLDSALSLGTTSTSLPPALKQEFIKYCKASDIHKDLKDKDFTVDLCVKILKSHLKPSSAPSMTLGSSLDGGGSQVSLFSNAESMSSKRIKQLEHEVRLQASSTNDVQSLRAKVIHMNERIRIEKEYKYRAEGEVQNCNKKIEMLSGHMEKMIIHLKHEGAHKLRLAEQLRVSERENAVLNEKCDLISRKSAAKDRLILELREGSKVLEDQLRLMDEKYMELRTKLDYARELGVKKIKKAEKVASDLRIKFAMSNGSAILDAIPLPAEGSYGSYGEQSQWGNGGGGPLMLMSPEPSQYGAPYGRAKSGNTRNSNMSVSSSMNSLGLPHKEPTMDVVLEKIRKQEGRKQDWTDEKLHSLVNKKRPPA